MRKTAKIKKLPLWAVIMVDLLALGAMLIVFALFHHVLPRAMEQEAPWLVSTTPVPMPAPTVRPATPPALENPTSEPSLPEEPEEIDERSEWAKKFDDHFSDEIVITENSYSSPYVSVTVSPHEVMNGERKNTYYVADIYIADIQCFRTYLANNTFGRGIVANIQDMAEDSGAIIAMTGDMYTYQGASLMLRNGELYRDGSHQTYQTHCVLYYDGTMSVFGPDEIDLETAMAAGAWQIWSFGPVLLRDSEKPSNFSSGMAVESPNPRTGVGYYEPGHYCFVVVDGRRPGYSYGMTFSEFADVFAELGCTCAYNLDGGGSTAMTLNGDLANIPSGTGRSLSDILLVAEPPVESGELTEEMEELDK